MPHSSSPSTSTPITWVPVRHHSPACARLVRDLAAATRPAAILIEGPVDFNPQFDELHLPHRLPISIYSYFTIGDGERRGAHYPFCVYSPEWQAIRAAADLGIPARFIDLPWSELGGTGELPEHRYSDAELHSGAYVEELCNRLGVDGLNDLWDLLMEIEPLPLPSLLERVRTFCDHLRACDPEVDAIDLRREAYMAAQIRAAQREFGGPLLVVTGGYHTPALASRLQSPPLPDEDEVGRMELPSAGSDRGIALTPYSYDRLDSLVGYEAGMPSPGFYHRVWRTRYEQCDTSNEVVFGALLRRVTEVLRERKQQFSTADLIAVQTTARGLARLRGRSDIWRAELIDGIRGALVKDEVAEGLRHPFLDAVHAVLRDGRRGMVADGASIPPLVADIRRLLHEHELEIGPRERHLTLDLLQPTDLARSRVLHQLRELGIGGYDRMSGVDLVSRHDLTHFQETWSIRWSPHFESGCIESSIYGATLAEASLARLEERAVAIERDAEAAARLMLTAALMGASATRRGLRDRLVELVRTDGDFAGVGAALGHLLYLHRYDEALGASDSPEVAGLLVECWERSVWLLDGLNGAGDRRELVALSTLLEDARVVDDAPEITVEALIGPLRRISGDHGRHPALLGASTGALWSLQASDREAVLAGMNFCAEPSRLGDYLTGLFTLARETVQRDETLVRGIDEFLLAYSEEEFLESLPALRLAFSYFTPREKYHLARTLLRGKADDEPVANLEVTVEEAAAALRFEAGFFRELERYGLFALATPISVPPDTDNDAA